MGGKTLNTHCAESNVEAWPVANISFDILVYDGALSTQTNLVPLMGASVTLTQPYSQGGHPAGTSYTVLTNLFGIADFLVPNGNILYTTDISKTGYTPQHFDAQQYGDGGTRLLAMLQPVPVSVTVDPPSASIQVGGTANFNASPTGGVPPYALEWVDEATGAYLGSGLTFTYTGAAVGSLA